MKYYLDMAVFELLPLLLVLFGVVRCAIFNDVATLTKARCYAQCVSQVSKSPRSDPGCLGNVCQQCLSPCDKKWQNIASCKTTCGSSSICQSSCAFLGLLKSNPSIILNGKHHNLTTEPGAPTATNKTVENLTMTWSSAKSSVGSAVYLIKKKFYGGITGVRLEELTNLVFLSPTAVLDVTDLCRYASPHRWYWAAVQFTFQVIALTEYSQIVSSKESTKIEMTRPEPVSAIAMPHFTYDAKAFGDKLKLTTTVTPYKDQVNLITQYAMEWSMDLCRGANQVYVVPRSSTSKGANTTISLYLYEKLKACTHTLKVYSLNQCIPSPPRTFRYKYQGCHSVSKFNRSFCYSFDPPATPDSARAVGSLAYSPLNATNDYRFNTEITWSPPTFPYAKVQSYHFAYGDVTKLFMGVIWMAKRGATKKTVLKVQNLEPNITVQVEIKPYFPNAVGIIRKITFQTSGIPVDQIKVRNLKANDFVFSKASLFSVRIHWEKPLSEDQLLGYQIDFVRGSSSKNFIRTTETFHVFQGMLHGEPLIVKVKPFYSVSWIKPKYAVLRLNAPAPFEKDIIVKHLSVFNLTHDSQTNTFTAYFKWDPPNYSYKRINYYEVEYTITNAYGKEEITCSANDAMRDRLCMPATTKENHYAIPRVYPHMHIIISVKPVFQHSPFFDGIKETYTVNVPYGPVAFCDGKLAGYYPDEDDCTAFYKCGVNGGTFHLFCPAELYWNSNNQTCDEPQKANCHRNNQSCCQGRLKGYYKVANNPTAYCVCEGQGKGFLRMCTNGLYWNEARRACLPKL